MPSIIKYFLPVICIGLLAARCLAQDTKINLIEKIDLHFSLSADPTPESVGFDNPKSLWEVEYELFLSDSFELEKLGRCYRNETYRFVCPNEASKKVNKQIRKSSMRIAGEKIVKRGPFSEADREISIPLQLSPEVIEIFNKAVRSDSNPTFVLFVKTRTYVRTADKLKLKKKFSTSGVHPLKFYNLDKTFNDYWNVTKIGLSFGVRRTEDGKLLGPGIFRF